jgi:phosphoribosylglycinamide formyltransferase-1
MKLAIFASGAGSTAEVLFEYAEVVITNNPDSGVAEKAKSGGIPVEIIDNASSLEEFGEKILQFLNKYNFDFISLNGWDRIVPGNVCQKYEGKITNNHPAPLDPGYPDFGGKGMKGLTVHQAVLNFNKSVDRSFNTEICIHLVNEELDKGSLLAYEPVEILENDTPQSLQVRVKEVERSLIKEFWSEVEKTGQLVPIERSERLVRPEEFGMLEEAKLKAIAEFQKGL